MLVETPVFGGPGMALGFGHGLMHLISLSVQLFNDVNIEKYVFPAKYFFVPDPQGVLNSVIPKIQHYLSSITKIV